MKSTRNHVVVVVTSPDLAAARQLARAALQTRLVACANLVPKIESHYWWQGKIESNTEVLLLLKTTRKQLRPLEKLVLDNHPYDTPEFIVAPLTDGNERYLEWITKGVSPQL